MPRQTITSTNAPSSPLFSQGVKAGPYVFVSGIVGIDPKTGSLAGDTIQEQTRQALTNCEAILEAGGAGLEDIVDVGILLTDPEDVASLNEEYARWFPSDPLTRERALALHDVRRPVRRRRDPLGLYRVISSLLFAAAWSGRISPLRTDPRAKLFG